jgi:hypothetical protein
MLTLQDSRLMILEMNARAKVLGAADDVGIGGSLRLRLIRV